MHGFQHWMQMEIFYNGLNAHTRMVVDTSANETLLNKSYNEAYEILERIANKNYQYPTSRVGTGRIIAGAMELDAIMSLTAQVSSLTNMIKTLKRPAAVQEMKVAELALLSSRLQGASPSDTKTSRSQGKEQCKAITLKSGTQLQELLMTPLLKKQLDINIPLVEALEQMPNYVKFMKDILSKKRMLGEFETIALIEGFSTMLRNKLPPKLKDPGSFSIPCSIGNHYVGKSLYDIGASINLMSTFVFRKLRIEKARPTTVTLQLADSSYAHREGKIEDVLVRVDKIIFSKDFIILECEADKEVPIILGRPFLATGITLIDVQKGELTMTVNDQQITFNVFDDMKCADTNEECHAAEIVDK
ncbi:hypothetical protein EPI10_008357 [Gossypium australe]|uniref:Uncharacterized protein n=1 Tax=Gossypium australe TaxID=47621 RepID=A0A5B6V4P2_9ROSI|nr:hypothetical protein EPI10_008357 [Gossypium australe]